MFNNIVPGDTQFDKTFTVSGDGENVSNLNEEIDEDGNNLYTELGLGQYETVDILAYSLDGGASVADDGDCYTQRALKLVQCTLEVGSLTGFVRNDQPFNLYEELGFSYDLEVNSIDNLVFTKQVDGGPEEIIQDPESHLFDYDGGSTVVLETYDNQDPEGCSVSRTFTVSLCNLGVNSNIATPAAGANFIPIDYFFGYSDTTEYYIKIHATLSGNVGTSGGIFGLVNTDANFITGGNVRPERVLSDDYGVRLTQEEITNGIPNDEIALYNIFLKPDTPIPSGGFKQISFYAVEPGVENCEVTTGRITLAEGVPHARFVTLAYRTVNQVVICPCSNYNYSTIRVWYYTEKNLNNQEGLFNYNGTLTYTVTPEKLAETNTQIFWEPGSDNFNPDYGVYYTDDRLIEGNDEIGFEAAKASGGGPGNSNYRALSGHYINLFADVEINELERVSYATFNRNILPPNVSWTESSLLNCEVCGDSLNENISINDRIRR